MENISYIGLSQQLSLSEQMNISANNLANMTTPGFKSQAALFVEYLTAPKQGETVKQVQDHGSYRDLTSGSLKQTFNDLDVAIHGEGYFAVQTPDGSTKYTRDGSFALNADNEIVNKSGYPVMGDGGSTLTVPAGSSRITITSDGTITTDRGDVGKLQVTNFENQQKMIEVGGNLLDAGGAPEVAVENLKISQGAIEQSNVNPIIEMNKMVEILRQYQATQKMLMADHERIRSTIQKLTKV